MKRELKMPPCTGHSNGLRRSLVIALSQLDFGVATLARAWGSPLVLLRSGELGYGTTLFLWFDKAPRLIGRNNDFSIPTIF
jgi:hypothetical protein